jgi:hypothetical protein
MLKISFVTFAVFYYFFSISFVKINLSHKSGPYLRSEATSRPYVSLLAERVRKPSESKMLKEINSGENRGISGPRRRGFLYFHKAWFDDTKKLLEPGRATQC